MNTAYDLPDNYYFGGGGDTSITLPALVLVLAAMISIIAAPRKFLMIPLLMAVLLPLGATVVILGLHFPALRLVLAAGWFRLVARRDIQVPRMNALDKVFLVWALFNSICFSILWGTVGAVTNRLGFLSTTLGTYFLVRFVICDKTDVIRVIRLLAITIAIIAPAMVTEHLTQRNAFSILGSPPLASIRDGAVRAEGPFSHPIIAGTIGAMLLPLFIGLWRQGKENRVISGVGVAASIAMAIASSSSTPLMTCAAGTFALLLWRFRTHLRVFRWGLALSILSLHLVMKAPVWMLISRTGGAMGGSGYHRAMLIDDFVRHFTEWCLVGTRTNALWGYDMWDVDNAFVANGVSGGLITFVAFIALMVRAYKQVGKSLKLTRAAHRDERLVWAIGASLFANTVGFFGIVYFDQSVLIWYSLLAIVSATAVFFVEAPPASLKSEVPEFESGDSGWWEAPASVLARH
jgi:hypothetical protein